MKYGLKRRNMQAKYKYEVLVTTSQSRSNDKLWIAKASAWTQPRDEYIDAKMVHSVTTYRAGTRTESMYFSLCDLEIILEREWLKTQHSNGQYYMFGTPPRSIEK